MQKATITHIAAAGLAEGGLLVGGLLEVVYVVEVEAQFSAHRHPPHEVGRDLLSTDLTLPVNRHTFAQFLPYTRPLPILYIPTYLC